MSDADQLRRVLLDRSVRHGDFTLASGQRSSYYIDCRLSTMSAEGQILVGRMGLAAIRAAGWRAKAIGGLTMGADPVAYAIAATSWGTDMVLDAFSVRKAAKEHGMGRRIEGNFREGDEVVIVEDVITSGKSAQHAVAAVEGAGGTVVGVLAVVDREQGGGVMLSANGHQVVVLTTASELGLKGMDFTGS